MFLKNMKACKRNVLPEKKNKNPVMQKLASWKISETARAHRILIVKAKSSVEILLFKSAELTKKNKT